MKRCSICKIEKPVTDFRTEKRTKIGYNAACKSCESLYQKAHKSLFETKIKIKRADSLRKLSYHDLYTSNPSLIDKEKYCPTCKEIKLAIHFGFAYRRKGGLRDYCKVCDRAVSSKVISKLRQLVFDKLGHTCCQCGFSNELALQVDHVKGGGNREHKELKSANKFYKKVLADTEGLYQILCANCNWIKRRMNNEEPIYELRLPSSLSELIPVPYTN